MFGDRTIITPNSRNDFYLFLEVQACKFWLMLEGENTKKSIANRDGIYIYVGYEYFNCQPNILMYEGTFPPNTNLMYFFLSM